MNTKKPVTEKAILILGAKVLSNDSPSPALLRRATLGATLSQNQQKKVICSGGKGAGETSEADVIANICRQHDVNVSDLYLEKNSLTTLENLTNSKALADLENLDISDIVTDFYHWPRVKAASSLLGMRASVHFSKNGFQNTKKSKLVIATLREFVAFPYYLLKISLIIFARKN